MRSRRRAALIPLVLVVANAACSKEQSPDSPQLSNGGSPAVDRIGSSGAGSTAAGHGADAGSRQTAPAIANGSGGGGAGGASNLGGSVGAGAVAPGSAGQDAGRAGSAGHDDGGTGGRETAGGGPGTGGSSSDGGAAIGGAGESGASTDGCTAPRLICEDFEGTAVGEIPSGWTRHGAQANVAEDQAHSGRHSLKLGASASGERRIYRSAASLGNAHWGRIFYKVELSVPDAFVHSTLVSLTGRGPLNGDSDYRPIDTVKQAKNTPDVGSRHNFIYNVQIIGGKEFGRETSYDYTFDGEWHCAEYHIDSANQSYALYWDGKQLLSFANGPGNYDRSDIPEHFEQLRVGWINYQSAPPGFTAWIDDIAFDVARIGCD